MILPTYLNDLLIKPENFNFRNKDIYTSKDILDLYLEFVYMKPGKNVWDEDSLQNNALKLFRMFQTWLLQLLECEKVIKAYSWMFMVSEQTYYTFHKIREVNMAIRQYAADMNSIMRAMKSPSGKAILKDELVRNYDFPDVDLSDIDAEWLWDDRCIIHHFRCCLDEYFLACELLLGKKYVDQANNV